MQRRHIYLICTLLMWGATSAAGASPLVDMLEGADDAGSGGLAALDASWRNWLEASQAGDAAEMRREQAVLRELLDELDFPESEPLAAAVIAESRRRLALGETAGAEQAASFAVSLAPSMPQAHLAVGKVRLEGRPMAVWGWAKPHLMAVKTAVGSHRHGRLLLANLAMGAVVALLVGAAAILVTVIARHGRRAAHDLKHLLPGGPPVWVGVLFVMASLAFAWSLLPALALFFFLLSCWFSFYAGRQELLALALLTTALGLAPPLAEEVEERLLLRKDARAFTLEAVESGDLSRIGELRSWVAEVDAAPEALFALARIEKRFGRMDEAKALYRDVLLKRPDWAAALVNVSNLSFMEGDLDEAKRGYEAALEEDPSMAEAWFGLSRYHYRNVDILKGQTAREKALELQPALVERYAMGEEEAIRANRYLADVPLSDSEIAGAKQGEGWGLGELTAVRLWGTPHGRSPYLGLGGSLLLLFLWGIRKRSRASRSCVQCGAAVCERCDRGRANEEMCKPCHQVFTKKVALDPSFRIEKELEVERWRRLRLRLSSIASLFFLGPLARGKALLGVGIVVVVTASVFLLGGWGYRPLFLDWPLGLRLAATAPVFLVCLALSIRVGSKEEV